MLSKDKMRKAMKLAKLKAIKRKAHEAAIQSLLDCPDIALPPELRSNRRDNRNTKSRKTPGLGTVIRVCRDSETREKGTAVERQAQAEREEAIRRRERENENAWRHVQIVKASQSPDPREESRQRFNQAVNAGLCDAIQNNLKRGDT